jgi:hypothetical protein
MRMVQIINILYSSYILNNIINKKLSGPSRPSRQTLSLNTTPPIYNFPHIPGTQDRGEVGGSSEGQHEQSWTVLHRDRGAALTHESPTRTCFILVCPWKR